MKRKLRQAALFGLMMVSLILIASAVMAIAMFETPLIITVPALVLGAMIVWGRKLTLIGMAGFAALAADRNTPRRDGQQLSLGVATGKTIYAGGLVMKSSTGYATPGAAATLGTSIGIGRSNENQVNAGADGAIAVLTDCYGIYRFANSAAGDAITIADIRRACYIVDDQTVARTSNNGARCVAGIIADVDASGVWVDFGAASLYAPASLPRVVVALGDAPATLTAAQLINSGIFTITPGAGRALTVDTAALIVAGAPGCKIGDTFEFTIVCLAAFAATVTTAAGITLVGNMAPSNQSATFVGLFTNVTGGAEAVSIYRKN
jgi:hypothetical protein